MKQMGPRVYAWSSYLVERRRDANGVFFQGADGEAGVLVDPVAFQPGDEAHIRELGGAAAAVLTRLDRLDAARECVEAFGCSMLASPSLLGQVEVSGLRRVEALSRGMALPAGLRVVALAGATVALYHSPSGTAMLSGAVAGAPAGSLSLTESDAAGDGAARVVREVRALLAHPVGRVLVTEGEPVLREAERALQDLVYAHDPAAFLLRAAELVWQAPRGKGSRFLRISAECSRLLGLKALDFEVTTVPPGKQNTLLHRHDGAEEVFVVLAGAGEVQTEQGVYPVRTGDILGFPPRYQVAHAIRNTGEDDLRLLSFGAQSGETGIAEYPESNKQAQWAAPGKRRMFYLPADLNVDYWAGERLEVPGNT